MEMNVLRKNNLKKSIFRVTSKKTTRCLGELAAAVMILS